MTKITVPLQIGIKLECKMPYAEGDGEPVSMSIEDIVSGVEGGWHRRLEVFRGKVNDEG